MWRSDYPRDKVTFPHTREVIEQTFKDIPEDEKRKVKLTYVVCKCL